MASQRAELQYWPTLKAWIQENRLGNYPGATTTPVVHCVICLDKDEILTPATPPQNIANAHPGVTLFCGHMMCKACYGRWEKHLIEAGKAVTCPTCRHKLVYTTSQVASNGCTHPAYAWDLPVETYSPINIPPTKDDEGSIPNFCHNCRVDRMNYIARHITELRQEGYDDFQVRNILLHSAGGALELTDFEQRAAFPPNANGTYFAPWVAPPRNNEQNYLLDQLRQQLVREGHSWRGRVPQPPPVGFFGLQ
ncbi:uncharacterized protein PODANS_2_7590 [Podospora anserina S mat+]|uniref:Podospora anserina S mat+ genomic DNA chromosome 2, supercontig 2 n=1 Tax=Podospora anserina (strain S / ATCC MYA-4624 / DSM 980 / FGSC 10383) TaxID=515849 RepID=B2B6F0_PODAN|nr:uncharacterized protein PODANS_2_7590 [Podospora anserina S mat+]CAP73375.1 unnamed protein product [Podospora anserina S mat+]CDP25778.1 Putative protein of unknown function [Podospora anserina S mat+]